MSSMKAFLIMIFLFSAHAGFSQFTKEVPAYYDKDWNRTWVKENAAYYRTAEKEGAAFRVKSYYISDTLQMDALCSEYLLVLKFEGPAKFYYENGKLKKDALFRDNKEVGIRKTFYENGTAKITADLDGPKLRYILFQDEHGKDLLNGGTAIINIPNESTDSLIRLRTNFEDVKDFILIGSFYTVNESRDTVYYTTETQATYPGGYELVGKHISSTLKYPESAKRDGIEGKAMVQFTVDKTGAVRNAKIYRGFHRECDIEAVKAVSTLDRWNPSIHRGKPVHSMFILPVLFKLEYDIPDQDEKTSKKKKRKR